MSHIVWLGSEGSYFEAEAALKKIEDYKASGKSMQGLSAKVTAGPAADSEDEPSEYLRVIDGVGIVSIEGPLVDGTTGILGRWFGVTGYGDIAQALIQAVRDPAVGSILLNFKSPGGAVHGVHETGKLIKTVDGLKPVTAYTGATMASAALWIGVSARKIYASETAIVGSVGAMTLVVSRERQLKEDGIDAVVVRSGEKKALGHPVDPMTEAAIADAQEKVDYYATLFLGRVAESRGMSLLQARKSLASGETFVGQQALDVNLIDALADYNAAFSEALKLKPKSDNNTRVFGAQVAASAEAGDNLPQAKGQTMPNPHIPSPEQLQAMMAGSGTTPSVPEAKAPETTAPEVSAELAAAQAELTATSEKLTAATAQVAELQAKIEALTTAQTKLQGTTDGLAEIVRATMQGMTIAMNGNKADVDAVDQAGLVAAHAELSTKFQSKFKAGGVAVPAASTKPETETVKPLLTPRMAEIAMSLPGAK